jgi:ABC-type uncharacterized transport system YnjBCD permease subunit
MPSSTLSQNNMQHFIISPLLHLNTFLVLHPFRPVKTALQVKFGLNLNKSAVIVLILLAAIREEQFINRVKMYSFLCPPYSQGTVLSCITFFNRKKIFDQNRSTKECFALTAFGIEVVDSVVSLINEMATQRLTRLNIDPDQD